ncbi:hypothetical protein [Hydrocarboniphaga daqingensis]|uniref:hypothetical protein n=1 Tax=Hydrocarboniphaga daqingensis TaxID=490188 RepID=UPI000933A391|nr:hypothetical protein [Hydrocarboniphaga daqingensis]
MGEAVLTAESECFNRDLAAKRLIQDNPGLPLEEANSRARQLGFDGLLRALENGGTYAFESTLGARSVTKASISSPPPIGQLVGAWLVAEPTRH